MKTYVNIKDVGMIGRDDICFIVCDFIKVKKAKNVYRSHVAYYTNFVQAARELHERFLASRLANSKEAKNLKEFIAKVVEIEKEWCAEVQKFNIKIDVKEENEI